MSAYRPLSSIADVRDGTHDTPKKQASGHPLITSKQIKDGAILETDYYIDEKEFNSINRRSGVDKWDVLVTMIGTVGDTALLREKPNFAIKNIGLIKTKNETLSKYIYYYLRSPEGKAAIQSKTSGTSQGFISLSSLRSLPIKLWEDPDIETIVNVLDTYEQMADLNWTRVLRIEEIIKALYEEWFIHFRFPGYEAVKMIDSPIGQIPQGWNLVTVSDAVHINPSTPLQKAAPYRHVSMAGLTKKTMLITSYEYTNVRGGSKFVNGDTLFARITPSIEHGKTAFVQILNDSETAIGSTEFIVMRSATLSSYYVYCLARSQKLRTHAIKSMSGASGRQRVQNKCFDSFYIAHPPKYVLDEFSDIVAPLFKEVGVLYEAREALQEAQSTLLPRLISRGVDI